MAEEKSVAEKLDSFLDSFTKRMDAEAEERKADRARLDSVCSKMDSYDEEKKADKARKDAEAMAADKARKDAEEKEAKTEEERKADKARKDAAEEQARKDAAGATSNADLLKTIAELEKRIPVELADADHRLFVDSQAKAERVAQAFGDSAGASRWLNGEKLPQYRRRLLTKAKQHSPAWKDVDLDKLEGTVLDVAETQIYADALKMANSPASVEPGTLRMSIRQDETGRQIREFFGDPEATWAPFKSPVRAVTGWQTKFH